MKSAGILVILFASFCLNALADDLALSDNASGNPYQSVVERNIFGLVPIPTNPPADTKPPDPPTKITPNGIMSIFGQLQALFKVAVPPKAGQPPHDQSYMLSEGERQDDIEVIKINNEKSTITFNNHGIIQELPLVNAPNISPPAPGAAPRAMPGVNPNSLGRPIGGPPGMGMNNLRNRFNPNVNQPGGGNNPNPASSYGSAPSYGSTPSYGSSGNNNIQQQNDLTPEAQALLMEKSRLDTQEQVDQGLMPPLPPTAITPEDATGGGGAPLVAVPSIPETK